MRLYRGEMAGGWGVNQGAGPPQASTVKSAAAIKNLNGTRRAWLSQTEHKRVRCRWLGTIQLGTDMISAERYSFA